jgi:ABC-type multidrug transport system fused ATPase/permease subunit
LKLKYDELLSSFAFNFNLRHYTMELVLVCGLMYYSFGWHVVAIVLSTFVLYVAWTVRMTGVSAELRKIANTMDGITTGKAVDALLNYETVSVFGNVRLESTQYDGLLRSYHEARSPLPTPVCAGTLLYLRATSQGTSGQAREEDVARRVCSGTPVHRYTASAQCGNEWPGQGGGRGEASVYGYTVDCEYEQPVWACVWRPCGWAALGSERASSALNAGQAVILAAGMTAVLASAALGIGRGGLASVGSVSGRVGDLVMANGRALQAASIKTRVENALEA